MSESLSLTMILPAGLSPDQAVVGAAGALAAMCMAAVANSFRDKTRAVQLKGIMERRTALFDEATTAKKRKKPETSVHFMRAVAIKFELIKKLQADRAQGTLIEAGFRSKDAIYVFAFANLVLPILGLALGLFIYQIHADSVSKWKVMNYIWPVLGAYIGLKLPWWYVSMKRAKRYGSIQKSLADVLDLMTICAEAGLSLTSMLDRVSRELGLSYPEMAEELRLTSIEIGFLPDRNKALSNLAERCKLPEIRGMTSVLIQTEKYGTPIAQALRVLSNEFRQARMLRAEDKAAKMPAKMTVPMIVFILPTLFIIIIAPAAVKLIEATK